MSTATVNNARSILLLLEQLPELPADEQLRVTNTLLNFTAALAEDVLIAESQSRLNKASSKAS